MVSGELLPLLLLKCLLLYVTINTRQTSRLDRPCHAEQQTRCPKSIRLFYIINFCTVVKRLLSSSRRRQPNARRTADQTSTLETAASVKRLFGGLFQVRDEVVSLLGLLHSGKGHLGPGDVLFGVLEVVELLPSVVRPRHGHLQNIPAYPRPR